MKKNCKVVVVSIICVAFLMISTAGGMECFEGTLEGVDLKGTLIQKSCPTGTKSCKHVWTFGISRVHSCGNGEDAEITLNEGEHKETYYCNWELCNGVARNSAGSPIVTLIVSICSMYFSFQFSNVQ